MQKFGMLKWVAHTLSSVLERTKEVRRNALIVLETFFFLIEDFQALLYFKTAGYCCLCSVTYWALILERR
jgi:hypothetical protein